MIGDRMDTDMVAGIETGLDTVLVLSGVTGRHDISKFPYRPRLVLNGRGRHPRSGRGIKSEKSAGRRLRSRRLFFP